jgi:threonyl-tRNA synthetase
MPGRLDAEYVDANGERKVPVMLHRAILGSFERFIGILVENHEGKMPLWLSPVQIKILNITDRQREFSEKLEKTLTDQGFRVQTDLRNEKIGLKIREATLMRVPYMLVVGDKEIESGKIPVRTRDAVELGPMDLETLVSGLKTELASRGREPLEG